MFDERKKTEKRRTGPNWNLIWIMSAGKPKPQIGLVGVYDAVDDRLSVMSTWDCCIETGYWIPLE